MKIELLKTFVEVSRTLHFRIASEALFITQSAVSARIKLLEDDLGVLLFDRSQRHLALTAEGHRLLKHAHELIFAWQKAKQDVAFAESGAQQLVVGSMMSVWDIVLQNWLLHLHNAIQDISFITETYNAQELKKLVLTGVIDLAFLFEPPFVEELITQKVASVPLYLVSTHQHYDVAQAFSVDYVMVDYGESVNVQQLRSFKELPTPRHHMNQPRIALNFILNAKGSAYLPLQLVDEHIAREALFIVNDAPVFMREIYAMYLNRGQRSNLISQALNCFQ